MYCLLPGSVARSSPELAVESVAAKTVVETTTNCRAAGTKTAGQQGRVSFCMQQAVLALPGLADEEAAGQPLCKAHCCRLWHWV
jgi:hypothetical protein